MKTILVMVILTPDTNQNTINPNQSTTSPNHNTILNQNTTPITIQNHSTIRDQNTIQNHQNTIVNPNTTQNQNTITIRVTCPRLCDLHYLTCPPLLYHSDPYPNHPSLVYDLMVTPENITITIPIKTIKVSKNRISLNI